MIIDDLKRLSLVYIGTPYKKFPFGLDAAFEEAARVTAKLMSLGVAAYSPIVHGHPLSVHGEIPATDNDLWLSLNRPLIDKSDAFVVVRMEYWETSDGIQDEIREFIAAGKPVYFVNPKTFEFDGDADRKAD